MSTKYEPSEWRGDEATIGWLGTHDRIALFVFSEETSWLGALREGAARSLDGGTNHVDIHLWTRATSYKGDSGIPTARWTKAEAAAMALLRIVGGGRALASRLRSMAPDRVAVHEP